MSVQAGVWSLDGASVDCAFIARVRRSSEEWADSQDAHFADKVGMLYSAFHTTPDSQFEHQPIISQSGCMCTWDGRLDNRDDLIQQLDQNATFHTSDAAIVARAFERWGTACFSRFIGDWAVSLWNPSEGTLILARDYLGIKPLFYCRAAARILWCTDLLALAEECSPLTVCEEFIAGYLLLHPEAHLTPYNEIQAVAPGSFVRLTTTGTFSQQYWNFNPDFKTKYSSDSEYEEHFRHLFEQSVRRRLRTASPILAELSGGLDSSSIVCMADRICRSQGGRLIDSFSFWDRDEPDEDDVNYISTAEEQRGRHGHHAQIQSRGDTLPFLGFKFTATPGFDGREEVKLALRDIIEQHHYRVVLSGRGGDEVNGQALDFRVQIADCLATLQIRAALDLIRVWSIRARYPILQVAGQSVNLLLPYDLRFRHTAELRKAAPWVMLHFARQFKSSRLLLLAAEGPHNWLPSTRDSFQTIRTLARDVNDLKPTMLEKRYPFLDQTLLEFLMSIPLEQVLRPGDRRSLMRRALADLLPSGIASRKSKSSTGRCVIMTLDKHWKTISALLEDPISACLGFIDRGALRTACSLARHGRLVQTVRLLRALALELWLREGLRLGIIAVQCKTHSQPRRIAA